MSHRSSAAASIAAKHALHGAITIALAEQDEIDISFGYRFPPQFNDAIAVTSVVSNPKDPNVGSTLRSRYDTIELGVTITCWRPGYSEEQEIEASDRAYEILELVDAHLRRGDNITLDGTVLWCLLGGHQSDGVSTIDEDGSNAGRLIEISATFVAEAHITR